MSDIKTFRFDKSDFDKIKEYEFGKNWPVVYVLENGREVYVGETTSLISRSKQHLDNPDRKGLNNIHVITDGEYNKSATLDIESWLIQYMSAEGSFKLQNGNDGLRNHNYYDKEKYKAKFEVIWKDLQKMELVKKDLVQIRNSDLFKYSPYKSLTEDQIVVAESIFQNILKDQTGSYIINGKPGTGKTILAVYLVKFLKEKDETKNLEVGLVVPMTSLRKTIRRVFSKVKGLKSSMVIGPNDVTKKRYDVLIVDEAHRLKQRRNITNYQSFDKTNKNFGLDNKGTELDWILKSSKHQIFFYDRNQSVRPADLHFEKFSDLNAVQYDLVNQQRVLAGEEYISFVDNLFDLKETKKSIFPGYDLNIYDDIHKMVSDIKQKDLEFKLCRIVAGYAWEWKSKKNPNIHDIEIDGLKLTWNRTNQDWVNSKNAVDEVGCIHTVQGYDLNYVGVIIGPELSYDEANNKLIINADNYMDANGWRGITDPEELKRYIINIYKTLLTRGIRGTYIYIVDEKLRRYFKSKVQLGTKSVISNKERIISPYTGSMIRVPLLGSIQCGSATEVFEDVEEEILVPQNKIRKDLKYFILKARGDSMNKVGIKEGDLVLCWQKLTAHEGDKVVALVDNNVTIKEYHRTENGVILKPCSTNSDHEDIIMNEGDTIQGIVQGVVERIIE